MCRVMKAIALSTALMIINVGIAYGDHWKAGQDSNADRCFQETVAVANGADAQTLRTIYCTRALRAESLRPEDRSAILYNRGIIQRAQGDLVAAQESFDKAVRLSRTIDRRNLALAEVARSLGDYLVALEQFDLLTESGFGAESEGVPEALTARRMETSAAYFASVEKAQACAVCHGVDGISVRPEVPTLAGRHRDYLEQALRQFRSGERRSAVMAFQAAQIADEDIPALASYFASREGVGARPVD